MAQRLHQSHSPGLCIRSGKRHVRLCTQAKGGEVLSAAISGLIAVAEEKASRKRTAEDARDGYYDMLIFHDAELDNRVRTTASRCKEYDRENPTAHLYATIFPEDTSAIIQVNPMNEPAEVKKVITRLQSLGSAHPLFQMADYLTEAVEKVNEIVPKYLDSVSQVGTTDAELQIAKADLIRQYLHNMFEAEKMFGRNYADKLFPRLSRKSSKEDESDSGEDDQ